MARADAVKIALGGIVLLGLALTLSLAVQEGIDTRGAVTLILILGCGALAFAAIRRSHGGGVGPIRCPGCSGLNSSHAPYCKHCGLRFDD